MTYQKPKDITYTQMAIFVDKNIYSSDYNEQMCFEYIYHLFYILAVKRCLFNSVKDYDDYAIYSASILLNRYKRRKKKGDAPIKSVLNYIKKILYPMYVTFQKDNFEQRFTNNIISKEGMENIKNQLNKTVSDTYADMLRSELVYYLEDCKFVINQTLKNCLKFIDIPTYHNIYLSCVFTLLQQLSVSPANAERLNKKRVVSDSLLTNIYQEESQDDIILYHLDGSMKNLIGTLVNRIKHNMVQDIMYLIRTNAPEERTINDILNGHRENYSDIRFE